jgi:uncharacterized protein YwgA
MDCSEVVVSIIYASGKNKLGRTAIQKLSYFISKKGIVDIPFFAYYYGPYSSNVSDAIMALHSLDFITEDIELMNNLPSNWRKYTYSLTEDGNALAKYLEDTYPKEMNKIKRTVSLAKKYTGLEVKILSAAAKTHFILEKEMKPMTADEINKRAQKLEWILQPEEIQKAIDFLIELGLVEKGELGI